MAEPLTIASVDTYRHLKLLCYKESDFSLANVYYIRLLDKSQDKRYNLTDYNSGLLMYSQITQAASGKHSKLDSYKHRDFLCIVPEAEGLKIQPSFDSLLATGLLSLS